MQFFYFTCNFLQKPLLSILFLLILTSSILNAKSFTPSSTDCDTLITKKGDIKLVVVLKSSVGTLYYQDCGDQSGQIKRMPRGDVQDIRIHRKTKRLYSLLEGGDIKTSGYSPSSPNLRLAPVGLALTIMGFLIFLFLFAEFIAFSELLFFVSIGLGITGVFFSIFTLRFTRNAKKIYKKERRLGLAGLLVGLLPITLSLLIFLFNLVSDH